MQQRLSLKTGDIGNAFITAPCVEKIWTRAGPEFGSKEGSIIEVSKALYGLSTSPKAFHDFLGDKLRSMGFIPTRADQDLWYKKSSDQSGYDYIATHVDDIMIAAKRPGLYMDMIEKQFIIHNKTDSPDYYLGNDQKIRNGLPHISSKKYISEALRNYQAKHGCLRKEPIPMRAKVHPELDESPLLDETGIRHYQHIIGICQWAVTSGRFDINYAVSSLSRFSAAPREGHLKMARKVLGYLKKYPKKGYVINPATPIIQPNFEDVEFKYDFGNQYCYFQEDIDPQFPKPLVKEFDVNIFCDADHGHDKTTGRSITGLLLMVGSTPISWSSKRQSSVHTSTYGAEFTALKKAVEEAVNIRYYLRSMGVQVTKPSRILVDNMAVILNSTNPGSTLNKKMVALTYHFVREHAANNVVDIKKIDSKDNYADPFTKSLGSNEYHGFYYELMCN